MSRITTTFASDDAPIHRSLERMQRDLDKLVEKNRKLVEASKSGGTEAQKAAAEQTKALSDVQREMIKITGQTKRQQEQQEQLNQKMKAGGGEAQSFGAQLASALRGGASQIMDLTSGFSGLQGAIQLVNKEIQNMEERQRKAADVQLTEAGAQAKLLRNLSVSDIDPALEQVDQIAQETGASKTFVLNVASEAVAAKGALSVEDALQAVKGAIQMAPDSAEEARALASGLLDAATLTGSQDPLENLGFISAIGEESRATSLSAIAQNMVPAMTGIRTQGDTPQQAAALGVSLANAMIDPDGRIASTAALQLSAQLAETLPEETSYTTATSGKRKGQRVVDKQGTGLSSTAERITYLQQHPLEAEKFLQGAHFETKATPFVKQLLTAPAASVTKSYQELQQRIPTPQEAKPLAEQKIAAMQGQRVQKTAARERTLTAAADDLSSRNTRDADIQVNSKGLDEILQRSGADWLSRTLAGLGYFLETNVFGDDPQQKLIERLEFQAKHMQLTGQSEEQIGVVRETIRRIKGQGAAANTKTESRPPATDAVPPSPPARPPQPSAATPAPDQQASNPATAIPWQMAVALPSLVSAMPPEAALPERPEPAGLPLEDDEPSLRALREVHGTLTSTGDIEELQEKRLREIIALLEKDREVIVRGPLPAAGDPRPTPPSRHPDTAQPPEPRAESTEPPATSPAPATPRAEPQITETPPPAPTPAPGVNRWVTPETVNLPPLAGLPEAEPPAATDSPGVNRWMTPETVNLPPLAGLPEAEPPTPATTNRERIAAAKAAQDERLRQGHAAAQALKQAEAEAEARRREQFEQSMRDNRQRVEEARAAQNERLAHGMEASWDEQGRRSLEHQEAMAGNEQRVQEERAARAARVQSALPPGVTLPESRETPEPVRPQSVPPNMPQLPDLTGQRNRVEPIEIKLPPLEFPRSIGEQMASIAEQLSAGQGGRSESLLPVLQQIAAGFRELLDVNRGTQLAVRQLGGGQGRVSANPALARADRNTHYENS